MDGNRGFQDKWGVKTKVNTVNNWRMIKMKIWKVPLKAIDKLKYFLYLSNKNTNISSKN